MKINCRDYKSEDECQILDLFKQVFGREMSLDFWKWRFVENPFGKAIIKLSFDKDMLIGHYAVIPMNVQVQGKLLKAVFSTATMVHQDYRGSGIFAYLVKEAYKVAAARGAKFVYGFPNKNSYYAFTKKLGWKGLGRVRILQKDVKTKVKSGTSGMSNIRQIERFDASVNELWDNVRQDYQVVVPRVKEFLNWRFAGNPDVKYERYITSNDNGHLLGYVVLKVYAKAEVVRGHILDMLSVADKEVVKLLLEHSYSYFLEKGIQHISCWIPQGSFYDKILEEQGFTREETETHFGVRVFGDTDALSKNTEQLSNWFLTMGDSDVF